MTRRQVRLRAMMTALRLIILVLTIAGFAGPAGASLGPFETPPAAAPRDEGIREQVPGARTIAIDYDAAG